MDGHGPRNQTGIARNTSRKDGIRAGAVSGPWRSQPVAETPVPQWHDAGDPAFDETRFAPEQAEPVHDAGPSVVRRRRAKEGRTGLGIAVAFAVATLLAGAAWWLTGTERWQEFTPETVDTTGWIGDAAGGGIEQLSEEELAEAERAWIERTTPGAAVTAPTATTGAEGVGAPADTVAAVPQPPATVPELPAADPPAVAASPRPEPETAIVVEAPEPPPEVPAPSLLRSGGFAPGGVTLLGQEGPADLAGAAQGIAPWRIGPMPQRARAPEFRLADPEGVTAASGRLVTWVPG